MAGGIIGAPRRVNYCGSRRATVSVRFTVECVAKVPGHPPDRELGNNRIRKGKFVNLFSLMEPNTQTMFFGPGPKIVLQHFPAESGRNLVTVQRCADRKHYSYMQILKDFSMANGLGVVRRRP
jgi:hypothetical protein